MERGAVPTTEGTQSLLSMPTMDSALRHLPETAYENLLVVSPWAPSRVESVLRDQGVPLRCCGLVPVSGSTLRYDGGLWTTPRVAPSDLTGLSIRFSQAMRHVEPGDGWVLIDNVQVLLMYAESRRVIQLLDRLSSQARKRHVAGVVSVDRDAVRPQTRASLGSLFDTVVER